MKLALPPALDLAHDGADGIFLIQPQFEVGKANIGSGGIVRDDDLIKRTVKDISTWLATQMHWRISEIYPSPILGGDGNKEFLMIAQKGKAQ